MRLWQFGWALSAILLSAFFLGTFVSGESSITTTLPLPGEQNNRLTGLLSLHNSAIQGKRIAKGSLKIYSSDGELSLQDDGNGKLQGTGTGAINYATGVYYIHFSKPVPKGVSVHATFALAEQPNPAVPTQDDLGLESGPTVETNPSSPQRPNNQGRWIVPKDRQSIPEELQGKYPIHIPLYNGVEQILLLSDRWVVVVTNNLETVSREIQNLVSKDPQLSGFNFLDAQKEWAASVAAHRPNWTLLRNHIEPVLTKYIVSAREAAGERSLDSPDYYHISSSDDPQYSSARSPSRVTRFIASRGGERVAGFNIDYAQYSYIEMPEPMISGGTYTIELGNGKTVNFLYDELYSVSRTIKVNQIGYLPDVKSKYAYLGGYLFEFGPLDLHHLEGKSFYVVNATTGEKALTGQIVLREANPLYQWQSWKPASENPKTEMSGEIIYELDLSGLTSNGVYFISVPGIGRSWPFKVGPEIYGDAFYTAMRGMFAQRCGIALTKEYSAWTRKACHTEPAYESECIQCDYHMNPPDIEAFDVIGATIDYTKSTPGPVFGWHDAADWDKNSYHYTPIFAMLTLYEIMPEKFRDGQLHLPHLPELGVGGSGNGIPDILDEAEFGLKVWKKSLLPTGAVAGKWETWTHPTIDDPDFHYAYGVRMQWLSLIYATAAAQFAQLVKPFDSAKAAEYEGEAKLAFAYGTNSKNFVSKYIMNARADRGKGAPFTVTWEDKEEYHRPYLVSAKLRLYMLTGESIYLNGLPEQLLSVADKYLITGRYWDYFSYLYYGVFAGSEYDGIPTTVKLKFQSVYKQIGLDMQKESLSDPYRRSKDRENAALAWGWGTMTNRAKLLLQADHLSANSEFKPTALFNIDYQFGTNPQGMSWTTGLGYVYPIHIQHAISQDDDILDPFPGITIYGPTGSGWRLISDIWVPKDAEGKVVNFLPAGNRDGDYIKLPPDMRRYATHPAFLVDQNEFTIHETMASTLFVCGYLMSRDWMPSEELKSRKPRADPLLFGYWYLP